VELFLLTELATKALDKPDARVVARVSVLGTGVTDANDETRYRHD